MTLHAQHATSGHALRELQETQGPVLSSGLLAQPLAALLEAQAENDHQARLVFNPSPEADSISEHLVSLLRDGTDHTAVIAEMSTLLRALMESNGREREHERSATGPLDTLTAVLHVQGHRSGLSIKDAADRLRGPLKVVARSRKEMVPASEYFPASCAIKDVIGELGTEKLRGASLQNKLGDGPHEVLLSLLTDGEDRAPALKPKHGDGDA